MDQEMLKTSKKQRLIISVIAILMLGSFIASYAAIVLANSNNSTEDADAMVMRYAQALSEKQQEMADASAGSFGEFINFKNRITAYNENTANEMALQTEDLKAGSGRVLAEGDTNYLAYYVGWCADESIFDSTFNSNESPSSFTKVLDASQGLIEGWERGVVGMQLGGIRELTIPGELAYKDTREICGGYNKPLKFIVMPVEKTDALSQLGDEVNLAQTKYQYAIYGIDYDKQIKAASESEVQVEE